MPARLISDCDAVPAYPGAPIERHPFVIEPAGRYELKDGARFWYLDFHWPRGLTPMGSLYLHDCYAWGTQLAASQLPLPSGDGLAPRLVGTHVYAAQIPPPGPIDVALRASRIAKTLPRFIDAFPQLWADRQAELDEAFAAFVTDDWKGHTLEDLEAALLSARHLQKRAWEIHFELMYPLLASHLQFAAKCEELGVPKERVPLFVQGYDNKILACDRELWRLALLARESGLGATFKEMPAWRLAKALAESSAASDWRVAFDSFLAEFGWRTEGIADVALAPWREDPTPALGTIKTILESPDDWDFDRRHQDAVDEREHAVALTREELPSAAREQFDEALTLVQHANFSWWNDEHNHYIDLRATIPLRMVCLEIARRARCPRPDDILFLFFDEARSICRGDVNWSDLAATASARRDHYEEWAALRDAMPPLVGAIPERVDDPIMIEIFGMREEYLLAARGASQSELRGIGVSPGVTRGRAVVLRSADELHQVRHGEILVCEATSPNWTSAFTKIAGCICDVGGMLTHAAIVAREYRIPCIVGAGDATRRIRNGDHVEIDGSSGRIRIVEAA